MKLLIVESPNKKQTITKYLGPGWRVEASIGHVCDLPLKELGVSPPDYKPRYELTERGKQTVFRLKETAKNAESVWLAMDPDREGEAIAGHIAKYLKSTVSTFYRVVFHEITEKAVQLAVTNPRKLNKALFDAQQARRVIDRLVGYQVSPRLNQVTNQKLSAGRVQSIAIRLLVERERDIRAFKPTEHFGVRLHFNTNELLWFANWDTAPFVDEDSPYVLEKSLAERIALIKEVVVFSIDKKVGKRKALPCFITTTLQKAASIQLNFSAEETMNIAQTLFEKGFITYHRTDNLNVSEEAVKAIHAELIKLDLAKHIAKPPNRWKSKVGAQEAHEAIRPTDMGIKETGLDFRAQELYKVIRLRALACQMAAAKIESTEIILMPAEEQHDLNDIIPRFIAKGTKTLYPGWRLMLNQDISEEKSEDEPLQELLPDLKVKDLLKTERSEILELKTKAPRRYSEPALITKLEKEGIGRPSTYAAILSNILQRGYVQIKNKLFEALPSAEIIYDTLVGRFQFMELKYTKEMETALDNIAAGKQDYLKVVSDADSVLQEGLKILALQLSEGKECPRCKSPMRKITGKNGTFWGCSRYKDGCKGTLQLKSTEMPISGQ